MCEVALDRLVFHVLHLLLPTHMYVMKLVFCEQIYDEVSTKIIGLILDLP